MLSHKITLGIQIVPKSNQIDTYELVDTAIDVISSSGIKHMVTPFETVMEGNYDELMKISKDAQQAVIDAGANECLVYYRIHFRKDKDVTFEEKKLDR